MEMLGDELIVNEQGVSWIERVIAHVQAHPESLSQPNIPFSLLQPQPLPEVIIEQLRFPHDLHLPPTLKRWLAFDASWLRHAGWFDSLSAPRLHGRPLDMLVGTELGSPWGECYHPLAERFPNCFLLPGGSDSRRIYVVTQPDALGEYPILAVDVDDLPYLGIMYPGFDVYMADLVGFIDWPLKTYSSFFDHPDYARRLHWHAMHLFQGKRELEWGDPAWGELAWEE
jgi:hypothetical protein